MSNSRTSGAIQWDLAFKQEAGHSMCSYPVSSLSCLYHQKIHKLLNVKQQAGSVSCNQDPWVRVWRQMGSLSSLIHYSYLLCLGYALNWPFSWLKWCRICGCLLLAYVFWVWICSGTLAVKTCTLIPLSTVYRLVLQSENLHICLVTAADL